MANTATSVIQQRNSDMVELLKPDFVTRQELTYTSTLAVYQALPCLRFLGAGGLGSAGEWRDLSGNGMHLSYNGNPAMGYTANGAPYWTYDGTGDFHSHVDEAHFQITGTETTVAAAVRGLTLGCWVWSSDTNAAFVMSKIGAAGNRSYWLQKTPLSFQLSTDGTAVVSVNGAALAANTYTFVCGRFTPSTELAIFCNDTEYNNVVGIPALIFNSSAAFRTGAWDGPGVLLTGRVAFPFVCACALSDAQITRLYNRSRGLFGV